MRFKTLYLAAVMLLAALQVVHADNAPSFWYIEPTDVMTGIEHISLPLDPNAADAAEACYDLGGRAIQQPQKGQVYIKGGKKHVE
ncbi:hypothetical protein AAAT34_07210 [Hallella faecis]|uniref:Uncharacterized protein n=1 Tax=Hallella faecis TaxID=2841596 RepID=A0ABV1FR74_9BACT|nr:hypothetical protein [Hallella faecis]MBU0290057.1 hypothetical protein [Hallella faecis]